MSTTVHKIVLTGEWCGWCLPSVHVVVVLTKCACLSGKDCTEQTKETIAGKIARDRHLQNSWAHRVPLLPRHGTHRKCVLSWYL